MVENVSELLGALGPDAVCIVVLASIWMAVTAVYVPGTGVVEALALALLALAGVGLVALEASFIGIALLVLAMGCFLALIYFRRSWLLIIAGAVFQVVGSVFLFRSGVHASVPTIVIGNVLTLAYHQIVLLPGLRIQDRVQRFDVSYLIGREAQVVTTLDPSGTVRLEGETWLASADEVIAAGEWVRIVGRDGLQLRVVRAGGEPRPFGGGDGNGQHREAAPDGQGDIRAINAAIAVILLAGAALAVKVDTLSRSPTSMIGPALAIVTGILLLVVGQRQHKQEPVG
jgi:membrane-bound serine protease (ClpP class)